MKRKNRNAKPSVVAWVRVMRLYNTVSRMAAAQLSDEGLSLPRFDVIAQLGALKDCATQETLGRRLMVTKGNVSTLIQKMAADGLISRREDPANRRRNRVRLTPKGEALRRKILPRHEKWVDGLFARLSRGEQETLCRLLGKILSGLGSGVGKAQPAKTTNNTRRKP